MVDYLEKLGDEYRCERWLVRAHDALGIAHVYRGEDAEFLDAVATQTRPWLGVTHPSLVPVLAVERAQELRLVIITGDQRGPRFLRVARTIGDAAEREAWVTSELAGIADALALMGRHVPGYAHRRGDPDHIVVGPDGHARLQAPIAWIAHPRAATFTGRGEALTSMRWLSPELAMGHESVTPASDVYQLATALYAGVTLTHPHPVDGSEIETLMSIVQGPPIEPPACSPALAALIARNLARDPAARARDPGALAAELRALALPAPPTLTLARIAAARPQDKPAPNQSASIAGYRCAKRWDELAPTGLAGVRHCAQCQTDVVHVRSIAAVIPLLGRACIAYEPT